MSNHRWCCCGEAGDCCDMQNCATFVAPNSITITYTGTITRTFDTGQVCTLAEYTYTISSVGNFQEHGDNCDSQFLTPARRYSCPNAHVSYQYRTWAWQPKNFDVECECPPYCSTPTWMYPCSACIPPDETGTVYNMTCDCRPRDANYFKLMCRNTYTGTTRQIPGSRNYDPGWSFNIGEECCVNGVVPPTGRAAALTLFCCDVCGCARPTVLFSPETTNAASPGVVVLTGNDTLTEELISCNPTTGNTTTASGWELPWFALAGECGCPDASTWSNPVWQPSDTCLGQALPVVNQFSYLVPCTNAVMSGCSPTLTCDGLPQGVCENGKLSFTGTCVRVEDPTNSTVCSYQFSYTDNVTQSVSVVIT